MPLERGAAPGVRDVERTSDDRARPQIPKQHGMSIPETLKAMTHAGPGRCTRRAGCAALLGRCPQVDGCLIWAADRGRPIAGWLIGEGFRLTGTDFSEPLLEKARQRWPGGDWRLMDMRNLDLPERFDGIIGWNSFFHLTQDEQRDCLPRLANHPGARRHPDGDGRSGCRRGDGPGRR